MRRCVYIALLSVCAAATAVAHAQNLVPLSRHELPNNGRASFSVFVGDLNGDSLPDIVSGSYQCPQLEQVFFNRGNATFANETAFALGSRYAPAACDTSTIVGGDFDGDGDTDLFFGRHSAKHSLLLNDGKGRFTDVTMTNLIEGGPFTAYCGEAADVNGDGITDVVLGAFRPSGGGSIALFISDGKGSLSSMQNLQRVPFFADSIFEFDIADFDSDGSADIIASGLTRRAVLLMNNGLGYFTNDSARLQFMDFEWVLCTGVLDADGDGDVDLFVGGQFVKDGKRVPDVRLFWNDGAANFKPARGGVLPKSTHDYAFDVLPCDLDRDGLQDLFILSHSNNVRQGDCRVWMNTGLGSWIDDTARYLDLLIPETWHPNSPLVDLDGDGDLDLVCAVGAVLANTYYKSVEVRLNLDHQLYAPVAATVGAPWPVSVFGAPGEIAVLFVSAAGSSRIPLTKIGDLWLDLATTVLLPGVVPLPAGSGSYLGTIPANSSLRGIDFRTQAVYFDPRAANVTLSNYVDEKIK